VRIVTVGQQPLISPTPVDAAFHGFNGSFTSVMPDASAISITAV